MLKEDHLPYWGKDTLEMIEYISKVWVSANDCFYLEDPFWYDWRLKRVCIDYVMYFILKHWLIKDYESALYGYLVSLFLFCVVLSLLSYTLAFSLVPHWVRDIVSILPIDEETINLDWLSEMQFLHCNDGGVLTSHTGWCAVYSIVMEEFFYKLDT